jgi:choline dehydrogenase-like flavoprotein
MPPLPVKSSVLFERGARKLGLHPFPRRWRSTRANTRAAALRAMRPVRRLWLRGDGQILLGVDGDPRGRSHGPLRVRSESYVFRVGMDKAGRATGVHYFDNKRVEHFQKARAVVLSASGSETPSCCSIRPPAV